MSVYVDDMQAPLGRLKLSHMLADGDDELHAMADKIGVSRRWHQAWRVSHYDICQSKRALAISLGAICVSQRQMVGIRQRLKGAAQ